MRSVLSPRLTCAVALALALTGCGSASEPPADSGPTTGPTSSAPITTAPEVTPEPTLTTPSGGGATPVMMTGTIQDGVESGCLVFTDEATGQNYSVTAEQVPDADPAGRVTVTGIIDDEMMSFCMQGPILLIDEIVPAQS